MKFKLSPLSHQHILAIWLYTEQNWGEEKANEYVDGILKLLDMLPEKKHIWRSVPHKSLHEVLYAPYREHFIFFRQFPSKTIGVIAILHQSQDIPNRLKEISQRSVP